MQPSDGERGGRSPRVRVLPSIPVSTDPLHAMQEQEAEESKTPSPKPQSSSKFWSIYHRRCLVPIESQPRKSVLADTELHNSVPTESKPRNSMSAEPKPSTSGLQKIKPRPDPRGETQPQTLVPAEPQPSTSGLQKIKSRPDPTVVETQPRRWMPTKTQLRHLVSTEPQPSTSGLQKIKPRADATVIETQPRRWMPTETQLRHLVPTEPQPSTSGLQKIKPRADATVIETQPRRWMPTETQLRHLVPTEPQPSTSGLQKIKPRADSTVVETQPRRWMPTETQLRHLLPTEPQPSTSGLQKIKPRADSTGNEGEGKSWGSKTNLYIPETNKENGGLIWGTKTITLEIPEMSTWNEDRFWDSNTTLQVPDMNRETEEAVVYDFLSHNGVFLDDYVLDNVSLYDIERWYRKKVRKNAAERDLAVNKVMKPKYLPLDKTEFFLSVLDSIEEHDTDVFVLQDVGRCIASATRADACRVYKIYPDFQNFVQYFNVSFDCWSVQTPELIQGDDIQTALVLESAVLGSTLSLARADAADRFPPSPILHTNLRGSSIDYVIYQPILNAEGQVHCVMELWRQRPFSAADELSCGNSLVWGGILIHYCCLYYEKRSQRNLSEFSLSVVKQIFEELVSLDQLIKSILEFAQKLVSADRASLFLVDHRNNELVSTVFDLKFEPGNGQDMEKKEIRMPINKGIAGYVAISGKTLNITDAYSDYRFNREVDEKTGYKTISILCMPINVQGKIIGVVQMVNKRTASHFQLEDEAAFTTFSSFFGLALHHARLYDRIMRKEQKYRVALEVLSYHNTCKENEVELLVKDKEEIDIDLNDFYLDPYKLNETQKCKAVITMFDVLFDLSKFDIITVTRFVLTVKKNYRAVPYHNFAHGWSVAHSMFVMLQNDVRKRFSYKVRLALFVASLCHDLDHRGYTNQYMSQIASPLAAMYSTSTLEHHHFNITVTILQQDGHNIFSHMSSVEFKELLGLIRQCILATDLAAFFPNLAKIRALYEGEHGSRFSWNKTPHRDLAMAISMTAADLSAAAKPWEVQIKTVKVIFEEFYAQGDKERAAGRTPIPMMDRNKPEEQPVSQVGFLSLICTPCYKMLYRILPATKPMFVMALRNLHYWKEKAKFVQSNIGADADMYEVEEISDADLLKNEIEFVVEDDEEEPHIDAIIIVLSNGEQISPDDDTFNDVTWEESEDVGGQFSRESDSATNTEDVTIDDNDLVVCQQSPNND